MTTLYVDDNTEELFEVRKDSPFVDTEVLKDLNDKLYFDIWQPPIDYEAQKGDSIHTVTAADQQRPDLIAYEYYRNVHLWWFICHINKILHPWNELTPGTKLIIPSREQTMLYLANV